MTIGWFDAFRENGAPTWYGENRTPVVVDLQIAALLSLFITPTLAYLLISPGIRRYKTASTFTFLFSMAVGAIILVSIHYPCWQQGEARVLTAYKAFSTDRLNAVLGVKIGLYNVNITLTTKTSPKLDFNERMSFLDVTTSETERALQKGTPYPMLKVVEYLSLDRNGFNHGRQYRMAGYYTGVMLWCAFACWILQMLLLCVLPQKFGHVCMTVGAFTVTANLVYALNVPKLLFVPFPAPRGGLSLLEFRFSHCFYFTLAAGLGSILFGAALLLLQLNKDFQFRTIFACKNYRHIPCACHEHIKRPVSNISTGSSCSSTINSSRSSEDGCDAFNSEASTTSADGYHAYNEEETKSPQVYSIVEYEQPDLAKCRSVSQVRKLGQEPINWIMQDTYLPKK
ncbi:unnamed protein product [Bursaphelenchus xylophilus]|uniref:(pine wood nematode) hypothetical protein n=1 Tax=Bursaphelenchus xylophilus TaxID=6326 RepID=A0A1I7RUT3_BURXY|nr:unnamed protein product [Bursaphelenchus xylophilus]CAG9105484.1 unnamed protein product [Bursaphelenchus xylophilus]